MKLTNIASISDESPEAVLSAGKWRDDPDDIIACEQLPEDLARRLVQDSLKASSDGLPLRTSACLS